VDNGEADLAPGRSNQVSWNSKRDRVAPDKAGTAPAFPLTILRRPLAEGVVPKHKPSPKSGLLPRSSNTRPIWKISSSIDFASDRIIKQLGNPRLERVHPEAAELRLRIADDIRAIVACYISECYDDLRNGVTSKELREALAKIGRAIESLVRLLPPPRSDIDFDAPNALERVVTDALNCELDKLDRDEAPDLEYVCSGLGVLREAATRVRIDEGGPGNTPDRIALTLVLGLKAVFKEHSHVALSGRPTGPFARFVGEVVGIIDENAPEALHLVGARRETLDALIASAANITT
jgi:hypothetical protein